MSDVQFLMAPACTQFSVSSPDDYCESEPRMTACFTEGDFQSNHTPADVAVIWDYTDVGTTIPSKQLLTTRQQVGGIWGSAVDAATNDIFFASMLRRHISLGPDGLGAIYRTDLDATLPNATAFVTK